MCLYATVFVLPVYLQQILRFTANQTGLVILPGALASAVTMVLMTRLLGKVDSRIIASMGAALFAFSMWQWSHFTTQSGVDDFWWPLIVRGVALGFAFIPLNNLAMSQLSMSQIAPATGLYNLMRQLGGSVGIALSATLVQRFMAESREGLASHVSLYNPVVVQRLDQITRMLQGRGDTFDVARTKALASINGAVQAQAAMLAYEKIFLVFGLVFLSAIPLIMTQDSVHRLRRT